MIGKVITLPNAQGIMERLQKVDMGANEYMAERFYPMVSQEAGHELIAQGVVMMLTLKIHNFMTQGYPPAMEVIMQMYVPQFIDALVDDKEVAEAAKVFHKGAFKT